MNDEIKEILDEFLKEKSAYSLRYSFNGDLAYSQEQILKDYITNLQKENKNLSKSYADAILFNQKRCEQNKELQQRIDNAIEWIKEHIETYQKNDIAILDWDTFADPRNLLKILGGEE